MSKEEIKGVSGQAETNETEINESPGTESPGVQTAEGTEDQTAEGAGDQAPEGNKENNKENKDKMIWTDEQEQAIKLRGKSLLVSAGAGSGKTAVLVERIVRIITCGEPCDIDRLLIVTFTNAAALEMKERILKSIGKMLTENPGDHNLLKQAALASKASIMTIDSFCRKIVTENFQISGIDPSAQILSEEEGSLMGKEAVREILEEEYQEGSPLFLKMTELLGSGNSDDVLEERIERMSRFSESFKDPEKWIRSATDIPEDKIEDSEIFTEFLRITEDNLEVASAFYSLAQKILGDYAEFSGTSMETIIKEEKDQAEELLSMIPDFRTYTGLKETIDSIEFKRFSAPRKFSGEEASEARERIKNLRTRAADIIKKEIRNSLKQDEDTINRNMDDIREPLRCFGETVIKYRERMKEKKLEKNRVSFSDIALSALSILTDSDGNPTECALRYQDYYEEIMTDEYQDSNEVQETILSAVSRNGRNVFMVGDVKQSIYRFRQADPDIFISKYRDYRLCGKNEGEESEIVRDSSSEDDYPGRKVLLYKNFRSRKNVIDAVNIVFSALMSEKAGDFEYSDDEKLIFGSADNRPDDGRFRLEAEFIDLGEHDEESYETSDEVSDEDLSGMELEALHVAGKIIRLVEEEKPMVFDRNGKNNERPIEYRDIVVLLRSTSSPGRIFRDVMTEMGIPCYTESRTGYFDNTEVRTILSLLSVTDNPYQDIPLLAVLRSPMFSFTEAELTDIRLYDREKNYYDCLLKAQDEDSETGRKVKRFLESSEKWREMAGRTPLDEFIWMLLKETSYYEYVSAMPSGEQRAANLKLLCHRAADYEKTSYRGLYNFIRYMDKLKKSEKDMADAGMLSENDNVVRIMSIHKSKGLEFPYVFLSNLGRRFNRRDQNGNFLIHGELGASVKHLDVEKGLEMNTLRNTVIKERLNRESISEEMRILYVAMTRAKERLFLTGTVDDREKKMEGWKSSAELFRDGKKMPRETLKDASMSDWIVPVLLNRENTEITEEGITDNDLFTLKFIPRGGIVKRSTELSQYDTGEFFKGEEVTDEKLLSVLQYSYPHLSSASLPGKVSVSMIKKKAMEEAEEEIPAPVIMGEVKEESPVLSEIKTPEFLKEVRTLTGAERGTAFHTVMMHINPMVSDTEEIREETERLVELEILLKEEADSVNPYKILSFLKSPLGLRFREAYITGDLYREEMFYEMKRASDIFKDEDSSDPVTVIGIIDAFFIEDGKLILLDYKTDYTGEGDPSEILTRRYRAQVELYREALTEIMGMECKEAYLYSVSSEVSVPVIF